LITLSDDFLDADGAQAKCKNLGGSLIDTRNPNTNKTLHDALAKYTSGEYFIIYSCGSFTPRFVDAVYSIPSE